MNHPLIEFTNEHSGPELVTMINELSIGADGWAQIAPFGDYAGIAMIPDAKGGFTRERAIQRLDKIAVTQMANEYRQSSRGLSGFFKKRPLYEGHPDIPVGGSQYPNKHPVGLFHSLACRDGGLYGEPILTDDGEKLIASKTYRALSGRWAAEFAGHEDGVNIYRPVKFLSAGLTNQPNLPVQLLNEAQPSTINHHPSIMNKIIAWLSGHGITLANEATEEQLAAALARLDPKLQSAAGLNTAREQFANERKARIDSELDRALRDGRITEADRAAWNQRLASETQFTNELAVLEALKPVIKTHSLTLGRGDRKVELARPADRRHLVGQVLAEIANEFNLDLKQAVVGDGLFLAGFNYEWTEWLINDWYTGTTNLFYFNRQNGNGGAPYGTWQAAALQTTNLYATNAAIGTATINNLAVGTGEPFTVDNAGNVIANTFTGNGAALTNLNAVKLTGVVAVANGGTGNSQGMALGLTNASSGFTLYVTNIQGYICLVVSMTTNQMTNQAFNPVLPIIFNTAYGAANSIWFPIIGTNYSAGNQIGTGYINDAGQMSTNYVQGGMNNSMQFGTSPLQSANIGAGWGQIWSPGFPVFMGSFYNGVQYAAMVYNPSNASIYFLPPGSTNSDGRNQLWTNALFTIDGGHSNLLASNLNQFSVGAANIIIFPNGGITATGAQNLLMPSAALSVTNATFNQAGSATSDFQVIWQAPNAGGNATKWFCGMRSGANRDLYWGNNSAVLLQLDPGTNTSLVPIAAPGHLLLTNASFPGPTISNGQAMFWNSNAYTYLRSSRLNATNFADTLIASPP